MNRHLLLAFLGLAVSASALAQSAVPNLMSYQSRVADAAGVPLGNTAPVNRIILFRIYDSPNLSAPANRLYSEQQTVTIAAGEFSVLIGSGTAISTESSNAFSTMSSAVFGGATRYLGVTVDDGDGNPFNDPELSPRQQIVGTPFAFRAQVAEAVAAGGVSATSLANNSVGTAALVTGAVTADKLAANAVGTAQIVAGSVGTAQVADAAVTASKVSADSIDGSKIVDGSITLADLSPGVIATIPKPSYTYNQGMAAQTTNYSTMSVFPIDVSDLGVDGEVLISYFGGIKSMISGLYNKLPGVFAGQVRVNMQTFTTGSSNLNFNTGGGFATFPTSTAGGGVLGDSSTPFIARSEGPFPESNFGVTGYLNSSSFNTGLIAEPASAAVYSNLSAMFPRSMSQLGGVGTSTNPYTQTFGDFFNVTSANSTSTRPPLAMIAARWVSDGTAGSGGTGQHYTMPLIFITHYYPGSLFNGYVAVPFGSDQANVSTNANAGGPNQVHTISSIATGTNKLTVTVPNPHVMQVGDTVVLAATTGAPAANGTFTITAVPDRTRFEITLTGATGTYSGGTVTHTPKYNKYRLWVAVNTSAYAVRVTVSDK